MNAGRWRGGAVTWALGLVALVAGGGCEVPRTQLVVGVDTDLSWGEGQTLESVVLEVRRGDAEGPLRSRRVTALGSGPGRLGLPLWVSVLAGEDDRTPVWLEVLGCARADGCTRETAAVAQRATVRFDRGYAATVRLLLARVCAGRSCALSERCEVATGRCIDVDAQDEVMPFRGGLPEGQVDASLDGQTALWTDAAPDHLDGARDGGRDGGRDAEAEPQDVNDPCLSTTQCGDCTARFDCGWCLSTRQCRSRADAGPLLGTAACPAFADNWAARPSQCVDPSDPCRTSTGCGSCTNRGSCGWCQDSATCHTGTSSGPVSGACRGSTWRWTNTLGSCL